MDKGNGADKKKVVEDLRGRLNWLLSEASEDEYSEEEVEAIRRLLDVIEPDELDEGYYNAEKGFERFKETLEIRMRIQDETRRLQAGEVSLADYLDEDEEIDGREVEQKIEVKEKKKIFFRRIDMYRGVIAAALVLALFVGGTVGAYAEKKGFFHWVKRDKDGMSIMTSPEGMSDSTKSTEHYVSIEYVPEEYREYIWEPERVPQGMEFVHYEVVKYKNWDRVMSIYENDQLEVRLEFICRVFAKGVEYHSQRYDSYEFLYSKEYNGTILEFFKKNSDDGIEYAVGFLCNNVQYIVQGNLDLRDIELFADEYCDSVVK